MQEKQPGAHIEEIKERENIDEHMKYFFEDE